MPSPAVTLTIPAALDGVRLDRAVAELVADLSRSQARRLIDAGHVTVNGTAPKGSLALQAGDTVVVDRLPTAEPRTLQGEAMPLSLVHEDEDILVVDKPAGLVVHPAPGHRTGTLVHGLLHHTRGTLAAGSAADRPGIVHRLDRDTSGLLVVAKTAAAHTALAAQFSAHSVRREYTALVWGTFAEQRGTIEAPIGRGVADRKRMAVAGLHSRRAVTHFTVHATFPAASELHVHLDTGRTHQVRVHCAYIGHGVIGDRTYGTAPPRRGTPWPDALWDTMMQLPGQLLHARALGLHHPGHGRWMEWESVPPAGYTAFRDALATLEKDHPHVA